MSSFASSATDLAQAVRAGRRSAEDHVAACIEALDAADARFGGVAFRSTTALAEARALDAQRDPTLPLLGVPFTVKDWIEVAGMPCAGGVPERAQRICERDAPVVARLRAAGAIPVAKTRVNAEADLHAAAHNPHDPTRTPGASSSGEAVMIAAGASPFGIGSDSGGSLRWPAHCCGIATHKPTAGLVPLTGHLPPIIATSDPRTVIGPMAGRVADLATVLDLIRGPDGVDASCIPMRELPAPADSPLRIAWFDTVGTTTADPEMRGALQQAREALEAAGHELIRKVPEEIASSLAITRDYWARPESTRRSRWQPWGASTLSADAVEQHLFEWDSLRRAFESFMRNHDLLLCPAASGAAPKRLRPVAEDYLFTLPFSLTGQPVTTLRAGTSTAGLPLGVQLVARRFEDLVALRTAEALERTLGDFPGPPHPVSGCSGDTPAAANRMD